MPRDIEAELRRSLQARATDITPDPALYSRVQARIRRGRTFRLAFAGLATAMVIAGVAVAAPRMMDRVIEFEPGPVATQPGPDATAAPTEPPAPAVAGVNHLVFTDDKNVYGMALDGESAEVLMAFGCPAGVDCDAQRIRSVAAFADSTDGAVTSVGATCSDVRYSLGTGDVASIDSDTPACETSVAFSPDRSHLAWIATPADGGEPMLHTVDWSAGGPGADEASFGLPWAGASEVSIQDWVWTDPGSTTASGYIALRARREDVIQMVRMPIERQADGAIGVTFETAPVEARPDFAPVAFTASGTDVTHTLEVLQEPDGLTGATVVRRSGIEIDAEIPVPDELFDSPDFNESDLWMSDSGSAVVFGNAGNGRAWYVEYGQGAPAPIPLSATIVHADLVLTPAGGTESEPATEPTAPVTEVEVYFGMTGADACVADERVTREVVSPGVARGAITELLEGPSSRESNEGIVSPFTANTAGALKDITIVDGHARVDFADFSAHVGNDSCTKSAIEDSLNSTLFQFSTITSTQYSFDGDVEAWNTWLGLHSETPPAAVVDAQKAIYDAALGHDWAALRRLSSETSCTLSDQKEPCVPYWKDQEANGGDPLGILVELLEGPAAKIPDSPMWVWPEQWAAGEGYNGPRIGIDEDGVWRYYVQQGG